MKHVVVLLLIVIILITFSVKNSLLESFNPGILQDSAQSECLNTKNYVLSFAPCVAQDPNQVFSMDSSPSVVGEEAVIISHPRNKGCLASDGYYVTMTFCDPLNMAQVWKLTDGGNLIHGQSNSCLDTSVGMRMMPCDKTNAVFSFLPSNMTQEEIQQYVIQEQSINDKIVEEALKTITFSS